MFEEKVIVVEDDPQIRNFVTYALEREGFKVIQAGKGQEALQCMVAENIDLMLLDLGLPDMDGMEVLHKLREWSEIPVIIVSARDQDKEKAAALDEGADDYLTKPFSATELMARIRVALRHYYKMNQEVKESLVVNGGIKMDLVGHLAYLEGVEIHLSPLEYNLLALFLKNVGKVLTYSYIIKEIWGNGYGSDTQALRSVMAGLRRKIEKNPGKPQYIFTEIGVGYRMKEVGRLSPES